MKNFTPLVLLVLTLFITPAITHAEGEGWLTDYNKAIEQAKSENKKVFINFTGSDWCPWCMKLSKEILSTKEFKDYAKANLVLLFVDFPRSKPQSSAQKAANDKLQEKFQIKGYPTVVVLNASGKEILRTGYMQGGPKVFLADLQQGLSGK